MAITSSLYKRKLIRWETIARFPLSFSPHALNGKRWEREGNKPT